MFEDFDDFSFDDKQIELNKAKISEIFTKIKSVHPLPSHLPKSLLPIPQSNPFLYKDFAGLPSFRSLSEGRIPELMKNLEGQVKNLKEKLATLAPFSSFTLLEQDDLSLLEKLIVGLDKEREQLKRQKIGLEVEEKYLAERERLLTIEKDEIASKNDNLKEFYRGIEEEKEFLSRSKTELESQNAELIVKNNDFNQKLDDLQTKQASLDNLQKELELEKSVFTIKNNELLEKIVCLQQEKTDLDHLKQELELQQNHISTQIDELSLQKIELDHEKSSFLLQKSTFDLHQQELEKHKLELTLQKEPHLSSPLPTKKKEEHHIEEESARPLSTRKKIALKKLVQEGQDFIHASSMKKNSKKISKREGKQKGERERSEITEKSEIIQEQEDEGKENEGFDSPSQLPPSLLVPPSSSKLKFSSASKFLKKSIFEGLKYIHGNDEEEKLEINNLEKEAVEKPELVNELMIKPFLLEKRIERRRKEGEEGMERRKNAEIRMKKKVDD